MSKHSAPIRPAAAVSAILPRDERAEGQDGWPSLQPPVLSPLRTARILGGLVASARQGTGITRDAVFERRQM